jgi:hypothetical protein
MIATNAAALTDERAMDNEDMPRAYITTRQNHAFSGRKMNTLSMPKLGAKPSG